MTLVYVVLYQNKGEEVVVEVYDRRDDAVASAQYFLTKEQDEGRREKDQTETFRPLGCEYRATSGPITITVYERKV